MVKITNEGFKGKGVYVGRPSVFGNPYPVKKSKHSDKVYSLKKSLELYTQHFEENILRSKQFEELVKKYRKKGYVELDCWCVNRKIQRSEEVRLEECRCHAEIIAYYLLYLNELPTEELDDD